MNSKSLRKVTLALDWTPNTNHLGFYVAKARGIYESLGLDVRLLSTSDPTYINSYISHDGDPNPYVTPCSKVADRSADFAMNSPEGVINWNTAPGKPKLKAIAAILQRPTSAIVTLESSGLDSPKHLDGKVYASYGARFEGRIVRQLIEADGGTGDFIEKTFPMLGIWDTILEGKADATWVFMGWEGIEAEMKGVKLNVFPVGGKDSAIPYGYAPCLLAHPDIDPAMCKDFLNATHQGWTLACLDPDKAAQDLIKLAEEDSGITLDPDMTCKSAHYIAEHALDELGNWGPMDPRVWEKYMEWLDYVGLLTTGLPSRNPDGDITMSLDQLRNQGGGKRIKLDEIDPVFSNEHLPTITFNESTKPRMQDPKCRW